MQTIWKFPFLLNDEVLLEVPYRAIPLAVQVQRNEPCLWMQVQAGNASVTRKLRIFGTGHEIDSIDDLIYVDTFQMGAYVWHVYIEKEVADA